LHLQQHGCETLTSGSASNNNRQWPLRAIISSLYSFRVKFCPHLSYILPSIWKQQITSWTVGIHLPGYKIFQFYVSWSRINTHYSCSSKRPNRFHPVLSVIWSFWFTY
jgi:hypothetical protein